MIARVVFPGGLLCVGLCLAIGFARGSAIPRYAGPLLDAVAATMKGNLEIERVDVLASRRPHERAGLDITRAEHIVRELVHLGVAVERLHPVGAGVGTASVSFKIAQR